MVEFDESKHPRDEQGRFTSGVTKEYRQNTPYEELTKQQGNGKIQLSNREWAMFYAKLGEIERGGYVETTATGEKLVIVENKIILTMGTYEKPKIKTVLSFPSEDELFEEQGLLRRR